MENLRCLAIIPARGGSKRIPRKNIKNFFGRPIISYSIEAAINSQLFERVIVSTDDHEIRDVALSYGAEAPFLRPQDLADDFTATAPVVANAITECEKLGWKFDLVCCIYPCAPFVEIEDIKSALHKYCLTNSNYCFPVSKFTRSIFHALRKSDGDIVSKIFPKNENQRTQDFEATFYDAGQFYWASRDMWITNSNIHAYGLGVEIPVWRSIDIDTLDDWHMAELIYGSLNHHKNIL